jgi:hypothetical protein
MNNLSTTSRRHSRPSIYPKKQPKPRPSPPAIDSESEVEEIGRDRDNDGGKRWLQVRLVLVWDYKHILTFSAGNVTPTVREFIY